MPYKKTPVVKFSKTLPNASAPVVATEGSSGFDLFAPEQLQILGRDHLVVDTGISVELPKGYEGQIRSRSGLAAKRGLVVLNSPGTIDNDYRGNLKVILHNTRSRKAQIEAGDRIAQIVFKPIEKVIMEEIECIDNNTNRGEGGLGSTGN